MVRALIFLGVLILHWSLQFIAWSYAESSVRWRVLWDVLATPLVHLFSGSITDRYFWIVVTANSALWATVLTYVLSRFTSRNLK